MIFVFGTESQSFIKSKTIVMKTKKTNQADLESRRPFFFAIGLVVSLALVLLSFSWKTSVKTPHQMGQVDWDAPDEIVIPSTEPERKVAPPPMVIEKITLVDDTRETNELEPDLFNTEIDAGEAIFVNTLVAERPAEADEQIVVNFAEQMPEFPGGMRALLAFISQNIKYPVLAQENDIQGKVLVRFVVNTDGSISDAIIVRGVDPSLDREALRVVGNMPRWKPGMQAGRAVRVSYHIPVAFVLQ